MTDSPLTADTRLRDAIAAAIRVTEADVRSLTDALLPLVVAEVRSAAATATATANLGLATTRELLAELEARIDVDHAMGGGGLDYTTVGGRQPVAANPYRVEEAPPAVSASGCSCPPGSPLHFGEAPCIQQRDQRGEGSSS